MSNKLRDTNYAEELKRASLKLGNGEARLERLRMKSTGEEEIRFSWWSHKPSGGSLNMANRPLDLEERHLLDLMEGGLAEDVFSDGFVLRLLGLLTKHAQG